MTNQHISVVAYRKNRETNILEEMDPNSYQSPYKMYMMADIVFKLDSKAKTCTVIKSRYEKLGEVFEY